jgi:two-component system, OmpR family, response regulator
MDSALSVVLVQWPGEASRLERLRADGVPRLLLVDSMTAPPELEDCLEDWVRVPASEAEVHSRLAALTARARAHQPEQPVLDDDGVVRAGDGWVALPPVEARLTAALLDRFGAVVGRDALGQAGWPQGAPGRNALDVHILRIRRRLAPLGIAIRTVRSRGYLLETGDRVERSAGSG